MELKFKPFNGLFQSAWISSEADLKYQQHVERTEEKYPQYFDKTRLKGKKWEKDKAFRADLEIYHKEDREARAKSFFDQGLFLPGTILKIKALPGSENYEREGDTIRTYLVGGLPGKIGELGEWPDIHDEDYVIEYCTDLIPIIFGMRDQQTGNADLV